MFVYKIIYFFMIINIIFSLEISGSESDDDYFLSHVIHVYPINEGNYLLNNPNKNINLIKKRAVDDIQIVSESVPAYALIDSIEKEKEKSTLTGKPPVNDKIIKSPDQSSEYLNSQMFFADKDEEHQRTERGGNKNNHKKVIRRGPKVWDQWGKWTPCSVTCSIGKSTRWRHCVQGGCFSGEKEAQIKTCTSPAC